MPITNQPAMWRVLRIYPLRNVGSTCSNTHVGRKRARSREPLTRGSQPLKLRSCDKLISRSYGNLRRRGSLLDQGLQTLGPHVRLGAQDFPQPSLP